jgi:hypothetical protein
MVHLAVETLWDQTAREVADAKEKNETDVSLGEFGKCAMALRTMLYQDRALSTMEVHFMDNHFQVLQMAYLRWKRKHVDRLSSVVAVQGDSDETGRQDM